MKLRWSVLYLLLLQEGHEHYVIREKATRCHQERPFLSLRLLVVQKKPVRLLSYLAQPVQATKSIHL